jgi:ribosomal protein L24E
MANKVTTDTKSNSTQTSAEIAALIVNLGTNARLDGFAITVAHVSSDLRGVREGDALLIVEEKSGTFDVVSFARVYRVRRGLDETTLLLDGLLPVEPPRPLGDFGIQPPTIAVSRLEWPSFEAALKTACGIEFPALPVLDGKTSQEQTYIRDLLQLAVEDDLLGPADGPVEEIIGMGVRDRYLVGKLAPPDTQVPVDQVEDLSDAATTDPEGDDREADASTSNSLVPSSFGFTFCVDGSAKGFEVRANWGRYERTESERLNEKTGKPFRCWKRIPSGGAATVSLDRRIVAPVAMDPACPDVAVQGTVSDPLPNGDRLVTLFLVNNQAKPGENQDQAWVFQPELIVRDPEGRSTFRRKLSLSDIGLDEEREALEMIYRRRVEFAVGHGVSVHATPSSDDPERAVEVRTRVLPRYEVSVTETPGTAPDDRPVMNRLVSDSSLDMLRLADMERGDLVATLGALTDDYAAWIEERRARIGIDLQGFGSSASAALARCESILERLREGIGMLGADEAALEAFRFANRSMASQRVHSVYSLRVRRGETLDLATVDIPENRSWRPFQLAFVLLSVPALANPVHRDRTEPVEAYADLLWFPTGGGKTEAYLGVAAFTMAIRRLQGDTGGLDGSRGLAVIMRYTLRLLTIQQFQRATTLMCAMEVLRRADTAKWGFVPFTIGLWVGQRVTPNTTEESHEAIERERDGKYGTGSTPAQLTFCPWCGSEIVPGRDIKVVRDIGRTFIHCSDKYGTCEFGRVKSPDLGLPVLVVDDEIYRHPPSMLIATVDKFALMAWRGQARTLFGRANSECPRHGLLWPGAGCNGNHKKKGSLPATKARPVAPIRPPDLIIQDEFHLISGPLGTMIGLYETAVDELSAWTADGKTVRPKIIASTATVRKADEQVNNVFLRRVAVFPPHGVDVEDNFFSVQRSIAEKPGRRYMGICSPGSSRPAVLIRVYVALLTAAQSLFERFGQA